MVGKWPIMAFTGALFSCCNAKGWLDLTEFPVRDWVVTKYKSERL